MNMVRWIKLLKIFLSVLFLTLIVSCSKRETDTSNLDKFVYNDISYSVLKDSKEELVIDKYNGSAKELTIESSITYNDKLYSVVSVGDNAFVDNKTLENVVIKEGITYIGFNAFAATNIKSVDLPRSVNMIYTSAFASSNIESLVIKSDISYSDCCFANCSNLKEVTFLEGVKNTPAFEMCANIKKISLSSTINDLSSDKFTGCENIEEIVLNNNPNYYIENNCLYSSSQTLIYTLKVQK